MIDALQIRNADEKKDAMPCADNNLEARFVALCKQELCLKIALKAVQESKKEAEKELAELDAIGQVKFSW